MPETISILYKLGNGFHRAVTNLNFVEAARDLIENLNRDNPHADCAVGLIQIGRASTVLEFGRSSVDELLRVLNDYRVQLSKYNDNPNYVWGSETE